MGPFLWSRSLLWRAAQRRARLVLATGALLALSAVVPGAPPLAAASADQAPPAWRLIYDYMVQDVCVDEAGAPLAGVTPIDGPARCPRHRDLRVGERLPYHKHDWAARGDRAALPYGYQRSDDFPVRTRQLGIAVVQTFDFGAPPDRYDRFDAGDGGQAVLFSAQSVFYGLTQDGGSGLTFFAGPACAASDPARRLADSWVLVDRSFAPERPGQVLARLTKWPERCPSALSNAFTRWQVRELALRVGATGTVSRHTAATLISDHFGGRDPTLANHLERFYFTRALGLVRWERWENLARPGDPAERLDVAGRAQRLAASDSCDAIADPPAPTGDWRMTACRQWTNLVAPRDPNGDSPHFWIDRLRTYPATAAMFAE